MTHFLCISVTLLDPLFHGRGDADEPEWPPSPMRLFQALLAGSRCGCRNSQWSEVKAEALRWLESCDPPQVIAPMAKQAAAYTLFVPDNDSDKVPERQNRLTGKVARPHRLMGGDAVHYIWTIRDSDGQRARSLAKVICEEARNLLALGWGIDQVVGNGQILSESDVAALLGRRWRAWRTHLAGSRMWRVPSDNSLKDLEDAHQSFIQRVDGGQYRPPRKPSQFGTVHYLSSTTLPPRPRAAFELPEGVGFRPERTASIAAMLRSLACRCARSDTHEFPGGAEVYVAGHVENGEQSPPRFTYLPLPTIGHERSDGMIRRFLVAEPFGGDGTHAGWAQQRLRNSTLRDEHGNDRGVLLDPWREGTKRMLNRYVDEARAWCTVTPVVLPGFDDGKYAKAEQLFLKAVVQGELPVDALEVVVLRKAPFWVGAQHPSRYFAPDYIRKMSRWHVHLRFREPVPGPLAIGAGRHVGLGLFASADDVVARHVSSRK